MNAAELLKNLSRRYEAILGPNFVGMYVHGSYAMGCFNPLKSDLDYIIVCDSVPDISVKMAIMDATVAYDRLAPAKGLEMHLMLRKDCSSVSYPPKFELHYSPAHTLAYLSDPDEYIGRMHGGDPDLGAHLTVMYHRGLCISGPEVGTIFGEVPKQYYIDSIMEDLGWSDGDCMYHVLNRCRTLAYLADSKIRSKAEGAMWALENTGTERHGIIRSALECYISGTVMSDVAGAEEFCRAADACIREQIN